MIAMDVTFQGLRLFWPASLTTTDQPPVWPDRPTTRGCGIGVLFELSALTLDGPQEYTMVRPMRAIDSRHEPARASAIVTKNGDGLMLSSRQLAP